MLYKKFAFLSLALLASSPVAALVASSPIAAEDMLNSTDSPVADDDMLNSTGNVSYPCMVEEDNIASCFESFDCDAACTALEASLTFEEPNAIFGDGTNITAVKEYVNGAFEALCANLVVGVCVVQECCPLCLDEAEAFFTCTYNELIPVLQDQVEGSLGGLSDTLLLAANELIAAATNETLMPTTGWGNIGDFFSDLIANQTCDVAAFNCTNATNATRF
jgi:hypothetical protein